MHRITVLLALLLCVPGLVSARTWRVAHDPSGDTTTIQAAVDSAATGDTVLVSAGTWTEGVVIRRKSLVLRGDGQFDTTLDGEHTRRVLRVEQCLRVVIEDLTVANGLRNVLEFPGTAGAGIAAFHSALTLRRVRVRDHVASLGIGAGVFLSIRELPGDLPPAGFEPAFPGLIVEDCQFEDNWAGDNGGHLYVEDSDAIIRDSQFLRGTAVEGGAISCLGGTLFLERCTFSDNAAALDGGALQLAGMGSWSLNTSSFTGNRADRRGGAVSSLISGVGSLGACAFLDNQGIDGGGLYARNTPISATQCLWRECRGTRGGGVLLEDAASGNFFRCTWLENQAPDGTSLFALRSAANFNRCLLGDPTQSAVGCELGSATAQCTQAIAGAGGCVSANLVGPVSGCVVDPLGLCMIPSTETCGTLGHADAPCSEPGCQTPAHPTTWGRLKTHY